MSSRDIRSRLDRLTKVLGEVTSKVPTCRFHGTACRMGANWPLPWPHTRQDIALRDLIRESQIKAGKEVGPHPRDVWRTDQHEKVPEAELRQRERELEELLASLRAMNDQMEAEMREEHDRMNSEGE